MVDYLVKSLSVWFMGFFPMAEIYVAIPAGMALGLGTSSVIFWAVFGNFLPVLLIHYAYDHLQHFPRINEWMVWMASEKAQARMNRWGVWAVLLLTPVTGVWIMAVTAKALGMRGDRLLLASFFSIMVYALGIIVLIGLGAEIIT